MDPLELLKWPYATSDPVDLLPYDSSKLPLWTLKNFRNKTETRKPFDFHDVGELTGGSLRGHYISNTDRNKGRLSERAFAVRVAAMGHELFSLPHFSHNYMMHIDFEVAGQDCVAWVDVKAPRALRRMKGDDPYSMPQNRYVCLEVHPTGSLYGGHADYVAFGQTNGSFVVAERAALASVVTKRLAGVKERSAWPESALWLPYVRTFDGRHTVIVYVDLEDISELLSRV